MRLNINLFSNITPFQERPHFIVENGRTRLVNALQKPTNTVIEFKYTLLYGVPTDKLEAITLLVFFLLEHKWNNSWLQAYLPTFLELESREAPATHIALPTTQNYDEEFQYFRRDFAITSRLSFVEVVNILRRRTVIIFAVGNTQSERIVLAAYQNSNLYRSNILQHQSFRCVNLNGYDAPHMPLRPLSSQHLPYQPPPTVLHMPQPSLSQLPQISTASMPGRKDSMASRYVNSVPMLQRRMLHTFNENDEDAC